MTTLSIEQLLALDSDHLPTNKEFYLELLTRMKIEEMDDYDYVGWRVFVEDVRFIVENKGKPLNYGINAIYWNSYKDKYIMYHASNCRGYILEKVFDTLEEVVGNGVYLKRSYCEDNMKTENTLIPTEIKDTLDVIYRTREKEVEEVHDYLVYQGRIKISSPLSNLSFYPLTETSEAMMILDDDNLTIIGCTCDGYSIFTDNDTYSSYTFQLSGEDIKLVLTILTYNKASYVLLAN